MPLAAFGAKDWEPARRSVDDARVDERQVRRDDEEREKADLHEDEDPKVQHAAGEEGGPSNPRLPPGEKTSNEIPPRCRESSAS